MQLETEYSASSAVQRSISAFLGSRTLFSIQVEALNHLRLASGSLGVVRIQLIELLLGSHFSYSTNPLFKSFILAKFESRNVGLHHCKAIFAFTTVVGADNKRGEDDEWFCLIFGIFSWCTNELDVPEFGVLFDTQIVFGHKVNPNAGTRVGFQRSVSLSHIASVTIMRPDVIPNSACTLVREDDIAGNLTNNVVLECQFRHGS